MACRCTRGRRIASAWRTTYPAASRVPCGPAWTRGRFDGPADVPEFAFPGGHVLPGCCHVLVEQLGHGNTRVGLPPGLGPSRAACRTRSARPARSCMLVTARGATQRAGVEAHRERLAHQPVARV